MASTAPALRVPFPYRVVIADDDPDLRAVLERMLAVRGCVVESYATGREVIGRLETGLRYHLACLDVHMSGGDGPTTLERIRKRAFPVARMPVLMITGAGDSGSVSRCIEAGANGILLKPFDAPALARYVDGVLAPPLDEEELRGILENLSFLDDTVAARGARLGLRPGLNAFAKSVIRKGAEVAVPVHIFLDPELPTRALERRPLDVLLAKVTVVTASTAAVVLWPDPVAARART